MKNVDYIIVGQGIAGFVLANTLINKELRVLVIDEEKEITSSKIAYGLCNPIVFKRFVKTFLADEAFDFAREYYLNLEKELGANFVKKMPLFKIFNNQEQQEDWMQKAGSAEYEKYLSKEIKYFSENNSISNAFGAGEVLNAFLLHTIPFLNAIKYYLTENASYRNEKFNVDDLVLEPDAVHYNGVHARKVIFCDGYNSAHNKYFSWLPFNLCKGERLDIQLKNIQLEDVISNNVVLIPEANQYILGSTYSWDELDDIPSETGRAELIEKFKKITNEDPEVLHQKAAVRPTTSDRRPFLGLHPEFKQLAIFNGMGTKSVMFCPFLAQKMSNFLLNDVELAPEVNIHRHLKHFTA